MFLALQETTLETRMKIRGKPFITVHRVKVGTLMQVVKESGREAVILMNERITLQAGVVRSQPQALTCRVDIGSAAKSLREKVLSGEIEEVASHD